MDEKERAELDALNAELKVQNLASAQAIAEFDAAVAGNPALMAAARILVKAAKIAGPTLAATFGGPLAGMAASAAVKIAESEGL